MTSGWLWRSSFVWAGGGRCEAREAHKGAKGGSSAADWRARARGRWPAPARATLRCTTRSTPRACVMQLVL